MGRPVATLELTPEEQCILQKRVKAAKTSKRDYLRAQIVLLCSEGKKQMEVAQQLNVTVATVNKWSQRFAREGLDGLYDAKGRGRKHSIPPEKVAQVIEHAGKMPKGHTAASTRKVAAEVGGISPASVQRIWSANDLKPHLERTFKLSNDPNFEEKFWDVIGLYLDPPEKALVLCCDEKTQCQALERTQPCLPLGIGHIRTRTHDYIRHGTVTLFAALNYLDGKLISRTEKKHTHVEWLRFLKQIDRETPKDLDIHLIADNYCTHKHEKVKLWLKRRPRFHMHFTPTSSSWMNMVERFFAELTADVVRRGSFQSVRELIRSIEIYLVARNEDPKPYKWKAEGEEILAKVKRARDVLATVS